ncbi:hypothetical protein O6H91_02G005500 [Diphasiastrum complanatum]|uniref:Uncharacterized protein n=2 Tax=Diphasiastrum complanatum TaxID=34168 RepID=A0ACC2ECG2_DIPCM|nr:hypothetical protein O6H91_02G005500 [Diphasiastrum complanatum]KAJ7564162.1 hypothetical protein O6H91_02G005500 [Diphasiastrum complanatum]
MLKHSENILHRLFARETCRAAPNTHVHRVRQFYENIVPSHTVYDVECPDHSFRKFTNDGQYLICFSRNHQELIVYRFNWLNYFTKGADSDIRDELPLKARKFESYFLQLYTISLGSATELICKDFFLSTENSCFGIFATTTGPDNDAPATPEAVQGVPSIERTTIHIVRLADGAVIDERVYRDDFIHLAHNAGVFMYDDLLAILSIRYQSIRILQVRETGMFVDVHTIGTFCREDDELIINSQAQEEIVYQRRAAARKGKSLQLEGLALPLKLHEIRDIDVQYDNYFGGLFGSLEMNGGSRNEGLEEKCSAKISGEFKSSIGQIRLERPGIFHANSGLEALPSFNQASSMHTAIDRPNLGLQVGTSWGSSSPDPNFATNGHERNPSLGGESGNLGITSRTGVSVSFGSPNIASSSSHGSESESSCRDLSVSGGSTSYGEFSASARTEGNAVQYIVSSRSLGSQQHLGTVEELMSGGSLPVPSSSLTGHDSYVNISAVQRQVGEGSVTERLSHLEAVEDTPSAVALEATDRSITLSDLGSVANQLLGGIKQRLLSFLFRSIWNQDVNPVIKAQQLKRFYYHFQDYVDLVMWKVQFLDRYHLLIKFGSVDNVVSRNLDTSHQTAFLAIYNMETTEVLEFQQNSSEVFLQSFEHYCDHFRVVPRVPMLMSYITSHSNNVFSREQLRKQKTTYGNTKSGSYAHVVKRTLASLPFSSQCQSPSVYFDQSLFHFDEKLISATERHKPCMENPIKFLSRRRPNSLKFKINPGLELGSNDGRVKKVASFLFHPTLPFVISIQQSFMQPSVVNFHYRK